MTPADYVNEIIRINTTEGKTEQDWLEQTATFGFGFIEEFYEWLAGNITLELGDLTAYYCLLNFSLGRSKEDLAQDLRSLERNSTTHSNILAVAGNLKRYFREGGYVEDIRQTTYQTLCFCYTLQAMATEPVLQANIDKLHKRLANTGTFHGSGDR